MVIIYYLTHTCLRKLKRAYTILITILSLSLSNRNEGSGLKACVMQKYGGKMQWNIFN